MPFRFFILFSATVVLGACAQVSTQSSTLHEFTVLQGVRIIDGRGRPPIENGSIVIRGDRIEAVLPEGHSIASDARVIDLSGKTVMPTLIAAHSHLGITNGILAGSEQITEANDLRQLQKFAIYGVGAVMSLGTDHDFIYSLREQRAKNQILTPLILTAGRGFGMESGAPPISMGLDQVYRPKNIKEVKKDMDELAAHQPDLVKIWVDDFGHSMKKKMDPLLYQMVIAEAHRHGFKVAAHVYYLADAQRLAEDGVDIFAHSIRDQLVTPELVALMKKKDIAYIPTLALDESQYIYAEHPAWMESAFFQKALDPGVAEWLQSSAYIAKEQSKHDLEIAKANLLTIYKAGIRVGMGTDSGATLSRIQGFDEHRELELMVSAGLTPMQALQAATGTNALILNVSDQMGIIKVGKRADLLVLDANPLKDIRNTQKINSVWIEGKEITPNPVAVHN